MVKKVYIKNKCVDFKGQINGEVQNQDLFMNFR